MILLYLILALSVGAFAGFSWGRLSGNREARLWHREAQQNLATANTLAVMLLEEREKKWSRDAREVANRN